MNNIAATTPSREPLAATLMRHFITILILTFSGLTTFSQTEKINSLIDNISNKQVGIAMQYVWYPVMKSLSGDSLIKIGKPATRDLIAVLSDTTRGIIAHLILSTIWNDDLKKSGWKVGSGVFYIPNNLDTVNRIYLSGLTFYQDNNFRLFAGQDELNRNKKEWLTFIATKSSR